MEHKELQKAIIGCVLYDSELADDLVEKLEEKHFDDTPCLRAYRWYKDKIMKDKKISKADFIRELDYRPTEFITDDAIQIEFDNYIELLKKDYMRKKISKAAKKVHELTKKDNLDKEDLQAKAQDLIFGAAVDYTKDGEIKLTNSLDKSFEQYTYRLEEEDIKGIKTGMPSLDAKLGGLWRKHLYTIGGDTSMGKTAFVTSMVRKLLKQDNKGVFISLEMDDIELTDRLVLMDAHVSANDFNNGMLNKGQRKNIDEAYNRLNNYGDNLKISYERGLTVENIKAKCRKYKREMGKLDFIVIDYLTMIRRPGRKSKNEEVGQIVLELRNMAQEIDAPVFLLSQTNRSDPDDKPGIHNLRASGWIEEISDSIWLVWRKDRFDDFGNQIARQDAQLIRAKERTGQPGVDDFYFYPEITLWRDAAKEDRFGDEPIQIMRNKE